MKRRVRSIVAVPLLLVVAALLVTAFAGVPDFGHYHGPYGDVIDATAKARLHVSNLVSAVVFDYRGLDTMAEEFIMFAAAGGVALLLRSSQEAEEQRPHDVVRDDAHRLTGSTMAPVTVLLGLWIAAYGYVTPGGGFQGGVAIAAGLALLWLGGSYRTLRRATPTAAVDAVGAIGAGGYVGIGLLGLAAGATFLENVMAKGNAGTLVSGGTIAALNWAAAVEVSAAVVLISHEFLGQYVQTLQGATED